ncbi:MAG: FecR family protein, partial [Ghiorsea sp.]|nr:FecR family protein [Ghiorsea sp.]
MLKTILFTLCLSYASTALAADGAIYLLKGPVLINGHLASKDTPIHFGDEVLTGDKARIIMKLDGSVYRMGGRSRLALPEQTENFTLNVFFGSVLAVFKRNTPKTIHTKTAVLGVRGTGVFLNVDHDQTYLCTC